jgi:FdrA protein
MGTEENKRLLRTMGFEAPEVAAAGPNDLIIALEGTDASKVKEILGDLDIWLVRKPSRLSQPAVHTLDQGLEALPQANLVSISLPGRYAAREARRALERGLNVFLFSSNVAVEDELALKRYAWEHGLIVMGPDCGTRPSSLGSGSASPMPSDGGRSG